MERWKGRWGYKERVVVRLECGDVREEKGWKGEELLYIPPQPISSVIPDPFGSRKIDYLIVSPSLYHKFTGVKLVG